jgi:hypothetical protein
MRTRSKVESVTLDNVSITVTKVIKEIRTADDGGEIAWKNVSFEMDGGSFSATAKADHELKEGKTKVDLEILPTKYESLKFKIHQGEPRALGAS